MHYVILDRDGVINHDSDDYIKSPDEWRPIPGSLEAISRLNHAGVRVLVASNQSGLARGLFDIKTLHAIHGRMLQELARFGGTIEAIFFCPHLPKDKCRCRKPAPGLLEAIAGRLRIPLDDVPMIGDSRRDVLAAKAAGAVPILVRSGKHLPDPLLDDTLSGVPVFDDLAAATDHLLDEGLR